MTILNRFRTINEADKSRAVQQLIADSTPDFDFFLFIILSILMATFGLILNSAAVIIGSMLIAPMLFPVLSFSLGLVMSDYQIIYRSLQAIGKAFLFGVLAAFVATLIFSPLDLEPTSEILQRTEPSLEYFIVAVIAGIAVSFSMVKQKLSSTLAGIAVSVALIPPIATTGVGLALFDWSVVSGSFVLFILNVVGIMFASMISFSLMNLYVKKKVAKKAIESEEKRIEREVEEIEKLEEQDRQENGTTNGTK